MISVCPRDDRSHLRRTVHGCTRHRAVRFAGSCASRSRSPPVAVPFGIRRSLREGPRRRAKSHAVRPIELIANFAWVTQHVFTIVIFPASKISTFGCHQIVAHAIPFQSQIRVKSRKSQSSFPPAFRAAQRTPLPPAAKTLLERRFMALHPSDPYGKPGYI
jgi:hypothetical protein